MHLAILRLETTAPSHLCAGDRLPGCPRPYAAQQQGARPSTLSAPQEIARAPQNTWQQLVRSPIRAAAGGETVRSVRQGLGAPGQRRLAALLVLLGCLGILVLLHVPPASAQSIFDDMLSGFEVMIGQSVYADVVAEYGPPIRLPAARQQWVERIFNDVVAQARRKDITYQLTILDSPVVNAFAAPGGYIFLTRGILGHIGDDADALANVLGHEIAHVEQKHGMSTIGRQLGLGLIFQLLFGNQRERNEAIYSAAVIVTQLMRLGWSREQEHESDDLGQRLAFAAGYDPMGMVRFFELLRELEGEEVPFLEFLRTHPLTSERIARARARAEELRRSSAHLPLLPVPAVALAGVGG